VRPILIPKAWKPKLFVKLQSVSRCRCREQTLPHIRTLENVWWNKSKRSQISPVTPSLFQVCRHLLFDSAQATKQVSFGHKNVLNMVGRRPMFTLHIQKNMLKDTRFVAVVTYDTLGVCIGEMLDEHITQQFKTLKFEISRLFQWIHAKIDSDLKPFLILFSLVSL